MAPQGFADATGRAFETIQSSLLRSPQLKAVSKSARLHVFAALNDLLKGHAFTACGKMDVFFVPSFARVVFPCRVPLDKSEGSVKGKNILPVFLHRSFCQRG
jgi:hypothetical protein